MKTAHPSLPITQEQLSDFCRRWQINELALFGSAARDEMRPDSDFDVMVEFEPNVGGGLWELVRLQRELEELLGRHVDVVEKGTIRNPFRKASIDRDLTVVYVS